VKAAEILGLQAVGTIPHALILIMGDTVKALRAFDEHIDKKVRRVALVDTFNDEKFEALRVAEALGDKLAYIRLDTPSNRRGDFVSLAREIRWELDLRGYRHVKIFLSGGIDEYKMLKYNTIADAYGVGTAISNAPVMDFSMDIVEINGKPIAKRGKKSGRKHLWRNRKTNERIVLPVDEPPHNAGRDGEWEPLHKPFMRDGKTLYQPVPPAEIRDYVLRQLEQVELPM